MTDTFWFHAIIVVICVLLTVSTLYAWFSFAPWVPTDNRDLNNILKTCAFEKGDTFLEIGCGTARVSLVVARQNPDVSVVGIELAFPLYVISKLRSLWGPRNMNIIWGNVFSYDMRDIDVVYVYGLSSVMSKSLRLKLQQELKPSAQVVSYAAPIHHWNGKPDIVKTPHARIFVYRNE